MTNTEYQCPNCGALHEVREGDVAIKCRYCGFSFKTFQDEQRYVLPVHYDSSRAIENFLLWVKKQTGYEESLPFNIILKDVKLHFLPFWTATVEAKTSFTGVGEDLEYGNPEMGGYRTVRTITKQESGVFEKYIEAAIPASPEIKIDEMTAVSRGRLYFSHEYVKQKGGVLHGATVTRDEAEKMFREIAASELTKMIGREVVEVTSRNDEIKISDLVLVYVPVWEVVYIFKGRQYRALIDASSSRVVEATYPPDILEKASYAGMGAAHIIAGVLMAALLWSFGTLPATSAFLGFLAAAIIYFWRSLKPTKAREKLTGRTTSDLGRELLKELRR
ncbi:hypothetical protein HRbin01_01447 [archaeon HR01]|nr:hypothetical protein HRbin01_01447 [archaeon HR01]